MPGIRRRQAKSGQSVRDDIRGRGEVFTGCSSKIHDALNAAQHILGFPTGHGHELHGRSCLGCREFCLGTHFTSLFTKLVKVLPGCTGNGGDLAHLSIEVCCDLDSGRTESRHRCRHRHKLLAYIFDRGTKVLKLGSGFIDLGKSRIGSSRLVL